MRLRLPPDCLDIVSDATLIFSLAITLEVDLDELERITSGPVGTDDSQPGLVALALHGPAGHVPDFVQKTSVGGRISAHNDEALVQGLTGSVLETQPKIESLDEDCEVIIKARVAFLEALQVAVEFRQAQGTAKHLRCTAVENTAGSDRTPSRSQ